MRNSAIVWMLCVGLAGCAGGSASNPACEVFSPAEIDLPTTQNDQRVEDQSTGDATATSGAQDC